MRLAYSFLVLVCFMLTLTCAKPSPLQDRLSPIKSTSQNYALLKPLSATISYIYYATQSISLASHDDDQTIINTNPKLNSNNGSTTLLISQQKDMDDDRSKSIINNASRNTIDVNHHNGPATALALVLFFCVLTF